MSEIKKKEPVSLATMLGTGEIFEAKGKKYTIMPMLMAHIQRFEEDKLWIGENQFLNVAVSELRDAMNKWLGGEKVTVKVGNKNVTMDAYCYDESGKPMSLSKAMADGWDVDDLRDYFVTLCRLSG